MKRKKTITPASPPSLEMPSIASVRLPVNGSKQSLTPFFQGPAMNMLASISMPKAKDDRQRASAALARLKHDEITDVASITKEVGKGKLTLFLSEYRNLSGFRVSTHKLLDSLVIMFSQNNAFHSETPNTEVVIPLKDYLAMLGRQSDDPKTEKNRIDSLRRSVNADLETLFQTAIEWSEFDGRKTHDFVKMRLFSKVGLRNGKIIAEFTPALARYLTHSFILDYPQTLLHVPETSQNTYYLGRKLTEAYRMRNNAEYATLSVASLLKAAPDIPSADQVVDYHYDRDVLKPFMYALNELSSFIDWHFCRPGGTPLSSEEVNALTYKTLITLNVRFRLL